MDMKTRIDAHGEEGNAIEDILNPVLYSLMEANGWPRENSWYLHEFSTTTDGWVLLTAIDSYDSETMDFKIPAAVIDGDSVDEFCEQLKEKLAEEKAAKEKAARRAELKRLEARTRILRGELSTD